MKTVGPTVMALIVVVLTAPVNGELPFPTIFSVEPSEIADPTLAPGSSFSVKVVIQSQFTIFECIDFTGASFSFDYKLSYDTKILTAITASFPGLVFTIDDVLGIVTVSGAESIIVFCPPDPFPLVFPIRFEVRHEFAVDDFGSSILGLHGALFCEIGGVCTIPIILQGFFTNVEPGFVKIDIKPGSDPNSINVKSMGVIPVAVLTTTSFDASTVDPSTVSFGRTGSEAAPVHSDLKDVDKDKDLDLILQFNTQDAGFKAGDTTGTLTGKTFDGTAIRGTDSVRAFFPGDVNGDLRVDILDLASVAIAYGSTPGSTKWSLYADFDQNGVIDIIDLATVALYYGQHA